MPDPNGGDLLVAALVTGTGLDATAWTSFLADQPDLSPKAWPHVVRLVDELPRTATNKVLKRVLREEPLTASGSGTVWFRDPRSRSYS